MQFISRIKSLIPDSFLMQMVTFSISSKPTLWEDNTLENFRSIFENSLRKITPNQPESLEEMHILIENWILLLKAQLKNDVGSGFAATTKSISDLIEDKLVEFENITNEMLSLLAIANDLYHKAGTKSQILETILNK